MKKIFRSRLSAAAGKKSLSLTDTRKKEKPIPASLQSRSASQQGSTVDLNEGKQNLPPAESIQEEYERLKVCLSDSEQKNSSLQTQNDELQSDNLALKKYVDELYKTVEKQRTALQVQQYSSCCHGEEQYAQKLQTTLTQCLQLQEQIASLHQQNLALRLENETLIRERHTLATWNHTLQMCNENVRDRSSQSQQRNRALEAENLRLKTELENVTQRRVEELLELKLRHQEEIMALKGQYQDTDHRLRDEYDSLSRDFEELVGNYRHLMELLIGIRARKQQQFALLAQEYSNDNFSIDQLIDALASTLSRLESSVEYLRNKQKSDDGRSSYTEESNEDGDQWEDMLEECNDNLPHADQSGRRPFNQYEGLIIEEIDDNNHVCQDCHCQLTKSISKEEQLSESKFPEKCNQGLEKSKSIKPHETVDRSKQCSHVKNTQDLSKTEQDSLTCKNEELLSTSRENEVCATASHNEDSSQTACFIKKHSSRSAYISNIIEKLNIEESCATSLSQQPCATASQSQENDLKKRAGKMSDNRGISVLGKSMSEECCIKSGLAVMSENSEDKNQNYNGEKKTGSIV